MTGSMYAAIAGLQTHMQKMNVIGNNIANANTVGFKPGVTVFSESLYTAINNSTAGGNQYGGTNAAQIGYGSQLGTIDLNMTTGSYQPTGVNSHGKPSEKIPKKALSRRRKGRLLESQKAFPKRRG